MNKKYLPAILTIVSIFVSTLVWEKITLPYDTANQIHGEYSRNFYNPNNDTLRFVFFVSFTLITFLISYLFFNKDGTHSLKEVLFQKPLEENKKQTNFNVFIFDHLFIPINLNILLDIIFLLLKIELFELIIIYLLLLFAISKKPF